MKPIAINDDAYCIEEFLSIEECDQLIEYSEQLGYEQAKVNIDGKQVMMTMVRNNERVLETNQERADLLWGKLSRFHQEKIGKTEPFGLNELFRFYKYQGAQRFKRHRDGSFERNEHEFSLFTFMVYLNDNYDGGTTDFHDISITPKKGMALVFNHQLKHEGKAVTSGIKYVLRSDIMYRFMNQE